MAGKTLIVSMPGPPREMTAMFQAFVKPFLEKLQASYLYYRSLRTINIGESALETRLLSLIDGQSDDFTTDSKYVDFPFKVKSSAMKILHVKNFQVSLALDSAIGFRGKNQR